MSHKERVGIAAIILFLLVIVGLMEPTNDWVGHPLSDSGYTAAEIYENQQVSDPDFVSSPNVMYNGTAEPFGFAHVAGDYVNLTWNHEAGTLLSLTSDDAPEDFPECNDFVYLNYSFMWVHDYFPTDMRMIFNFSTEVQGFDQTGFSHWFNPSNFFSVHFWIVTALNDWIRLYYSSDTYITWEYNRYYVYFQYDLRSRMVPHFTKNANLSLVIGLVPRPSFFVTEIDEGYLYDLLDGSITLTVRNFEFVTVLDRFIDDAEAPSYWGHWDGIVDLVNPYGIDIAVDGTIYVGGGLSGVYYEKHNLYMSKWQPDLNLILTREIDTVYEDLPHGMAVASDNSVYVIGERRHSQINTEVVLVKWGFLDLHSWTNVQNLSAIFVPRDVCVNVDGTILGIIACRDSPTTPLYFQILKWSSTGPLLWNKSFYVSCDWITPSDDGTFYTMSRTGELLHWTADGTIVSTITLSIADSFFYDGSEYVYTWGKQESIQPGGDLGFVAKWRLDGTQVWNASFNRWWYSRMTHSGIQVAENGTVYVVGIIQPTFDPFLLKFNEGGVLLYNKTWRLTASDWSFAYANPLAIGVDGLVYACGRSGGDHTELDIIAFGAGPGPDEWVYSPPDPSTTTSSTASAPTSVTSPSTSPTTTPSTTPTPLPPDTWPASMPIIIISGTILALVVIFYGWKSRRGI